MNIKKAWNRFKFNVKKHSPEIKLYSGVVLNIGSTGWMIWKSLDPNTRKLIDEFNELKEEDKVGAIEILVKNLVKIYGIPVVIYIISHFLVINSHAEMKARNAALASSNAALAAAVAAAGHTALSRTNEDGRETPYTPDEIKNMDAETFQTLSEEEWEHFAHDAATVSETGISPFAFIFDKNNPNYTDDANNNLTFCLAKERECQDFINHEGYITIRDIKRIFGCYDVTRMDFIAGIYDHGGTGPTPVIDLGIDECYTKDNSALRMTYRGEMPMILINPQGIDPNLMADSNIWLNKIVTF
jgi:hypothetical protein